MTEGSDDVPTWDLQRPSARRSLLLCGAGALIGLAVAGFGLFTAQGTRTASVPAEDAALVNGVPILRADLIQQLGAMNGAGLSNATAAQKRKLLDDMIREELYVQRGIEMGLANDDTDVRTALVAATEAQVAQDAVTTRPAEQELQSWYAEHRDRYASEGTMTLDEFILPHGGGSAAKAAALRAGASPASLGLKASGRVNDGEEFYFAARIHLGEGLFAVARTVADGAVSNPIPAPDGDHVLRMIRNLRPVPAPYAEVRDRVLRDFLDDKVARLQGGNERFLRKRADIKIARDLQ